jgi:hypothetical protein
LFSLSLDRYDRACHGLFRKRITPVNTLTGRVAIGTLIVAAFPAITHCKGVPALASGFFLFNNERYGALGHHAKNLLYHVLLGVFTSQKTSLSIVTRRRSEVETLGENI